MPGNAVFLVGSDISGAVSLDATDSSVVAQELRWEGTVATGATPYLTTHLPVVDRQLLPLAAADLRLLPLATTEPY